MTSLLRFEDDRDFRGYPTSHPRPRPASTRDDERSNEMSTKNHAVVRARGFGAGGAEPVGSLWPPFYLKVELKTPNRPNGKVCD